MSNLKDIILSEISNDKESVFKCDDSVGSTYISQDNNGRYRIEMLMDMSLDLRAHIVEAILSPNELESILEKGEYDSVGEAIECGACAFTVSLCYYENYYPTLGDNYTSGKAVVIECTEVYSDKTYSVLPNEQEWFLDCFMTEFLEGDVTNETLFNNLSDKTTKYSKEHSTSSLETSQPK